jgi:hypothetical protein
VFLASIAIREDVRRQVHDSRCPADDGGKHDQPSRDAIELHDVTLLRLKPEKASE